MRLVTVCLALGALPLFAGGRGGQGAPVTLYTDFQQPPPEAVLDAIQDELDTVMAPAGLHFEWYSLSQAEGHVAAQLAIIHFKGRCDAENLRPESGYPGPLGWTHVSDGEILPFIDVNCEGLRMFVQRDLLGVSSPEREATFGRAMARVLAHELYHLLANTKAHARGGIAKAYYSVAELLADSLQFGKKECESLRSKTARLTLEAPVEGQ